MTVSAAPGQAEPVVQYRSTFADDKAQWSGWANEDPSQRLELVPDAGQGQPGLHLSLAGTHWNTAIVTFPKPIKVTPATVVRFKLKTSYSEGINIYSSNGARYFIKYSAPESGDWFIVQKYLATAGYKSGGNGVPVNEVIDIEGKDLASIQVSTQGKDVWISDFQVFEADKPVDELPAPELLYQGKYEPQKYPIVDSFFPYGVIYQHVADMVNGDLFGQNPLERYDVSLGDIKRHYMNTFSNFVDPVKIDERLRLAQKNDLRLIETKYAGVDLATSPGAAELIKRVSKHPSLLAWYGADEPTNYKPWLDNKLFVNAIDKEHPFTSAFNHLDAAIALGKYSEVVMVDPYSTIKGSGSVDNLLWHANYARIAKRYTAGKRIWLIAQSYGDRKSMRYNTPAEMRFEVFNCLSAGVDGLIFFIYNDMSSYLEPHRQREKFDETLVDPWFNGNPTFDELARLGRDVIPVMPSFMDKTELENAAGFSYDKGKLVFQGFKAEPGNLIILANKSLDQKYRGVVRATLAPGQALYDLIKLVPVKGSALNLDLAPGDGGLYLVANEASWKTLKQEITARKQQNELGLLNLDTQALKTAQFKTADLEKLLTTATAELAKGDLSKSGKAIDLAKIRRLALENGNGEYIRQKKVLQEIRESFGATHATIRTRIDKVDGSTDPEWLAIFAQMKQLSRQYFELNGKHDRGDLTIGKAADELKVSVDNLQRTVTERVAGLK
jgi:hypothetical protein